ncbi:lipopolysaccharide assembly LapA domain-containing protein [Nocardia sp. 348MFTsu5.1]|uniref:LapA family protein n=1 Tax=Nocardia sp. 348MFTsu5.1 TaxID=1172185 RepID=UPI00039FA900|nr:lipopolysaccharide assembly protein LapA domain-containing protein [Nocardia sp. 348MFTsu5.1]
MTQPPDGYPQEPAGNYLPPDQAPQANYPVAGEVPAADHRDEFNRQALDDVKHTRINALWVGLIAGAIITLLLLIFIVQNVESQSIHLLFWTVELPLGVSLLIAAILGAVITGIVGSLRMYQVRRAVKKAQV